MPFERVLIGNDGSAAAMTALALARRLAAPQAWLVSFTVAETHFAAHAGWDAAVWDKQIRADAEAARVAAERVLRNDPRAETRVVSGYAEPTLLAAIDEWDVDLVALGSHGHSRMGGILLGSVATRLVHDAPCAVLVARGQPGIGHFPRSVVVGMDGSPAALEAETVARAIASATGAHVRDLTATGGKRLSDGAVLGTQVDDRSPVEALVDASRSCDLLVVGSRGHHGLAALGSVAERVAHEAVCSVLIVRPAREGRRTVHAQPGARAAGA